MEQIADNVYVETDYEGVNVGAIFTAKGVIAIDAPSYPRDARDWALKLASLNKTAVRHLILTDYNGDRILNVRWLNAPLITQQATAEKLNSYDKRYPPSLIESLAVRNPDRSRDLNNGPAEKPVISFTQKMSLIADDHTVSLIAAPGPTPGNLWVFLPASGILFTGDTVTVDHHPLLTEATVWQWLATLETLSKWPQKGITLVPGRGPLSDLSAVRPTYDYIYQMCQRIEQHVARSLPREEITHYVPEFLSMFPIHNLPTDWVRRQIKSGLARVYDEIQLSHNGHRKDK